MSLNGSGHPSAIYLQESDIQYIERLSEWMRKGLQIGKVDGVVEVTNRWLTPTEACAIGFALIGKFYNARYALLATGSNPRLKQCAAILGVPELLVEKISLVHQHGQSAEMICNALTFQAGLYGPLQQAAFNGYQARVPLQFRTLCSLA